MCLSEVVQRRNGKSVRTRKDILGCYHRQGDRINVDQAVDRFLGRVFGYACSVSSTIIGTLEPQSMSPV